MNNSAWTPDGDAVACLLPMTGLLRREKMQAREFSVAVRFTNFTEVGTSHRFQHPQFLNSVINEAMEQMFRGIMADQRLPVRQIRLAMFNLEKLDTHPTLWGRTHEERWGAVDDVTHQLNQQLGKTALMTGAQYALRHGDESQRQPKAKCPFARHHRPGTLPMVAGARPL